MLGLGPRPPGKATPGRATLFSPWVAGWAGRHHPPNPQKIIKIPTLQPLVRGRAGAGCLHPWARSEVKAAQTKSSQATWVKKKKKKSEKEKETCFETSDLLF